MVCTKVVRSRVNLYYLFYGHTCKVITSTIRTLCQINGAHLFPVYLPFFPSFVKLKTTSSCKSKQAPMLSSNKDVQKKRVKITKKRCDNCLRILNVPVSQKYCRCEGTLDLIPKVVFQAETKKESCKCDKICKSCYSWHLQVPCALKRCKCGFLLFKVQWPTGIDKCIPAHGMNLFIDPID
jgi:hypothetical protein